MADVTAISAAATVPGGAGNLTKEQFGDFLETNFRMANADEMKAPKQGLNFYNVMSTDLDHEKFTSVTGFRTMPKSRDNENVPLGEVVQGFDLTLTPDDYRMGFGYEKRLAETGQYSLITKIQRALRKSADDTIELIAADPYNRAFGATAPWLASDGYYLCDAGRPLEDGSGTWSNLETASALTQNSLETALVNARKQVNKRGVKAPVKMRTLVVPPDLERKAKELLGSDKAPEDALNRTNVYQNSLKIAVWDYLTDTNAWFLKSDEELEVYWLWRKMTDVETYTTGNPDVVYQRARFSAVTGAGRPHGIVGNAGA